MEENSFFKNKYPFCLYLFSYTVKQRKEKYLLWFSRISICYILFFFSLSLSPDSQLAFASLFFIKLLNFRLVYLSSFESKHLVFLVSLIHNLHWNLGFTDCINVDLDLCFVGSIKSKTLSEIMCLWRFMRLKKKKSVITIVKS